MNKKFLSAILFGALMVTSTGTFVSCKDYDDDIENLQGQISANTTAIAELKALIGNGDYVTSVSVNGQNLVVNTKNGSTNVALPKHEDKVGSICTVEDGVLYIDGVATDIKVCETPIVEEEEFLPAVEIVDGEWAVLQEDGSYLSTGVAVSSVAVTGDEQNGYILTVKDAEGNATVVELPTAASLISSIVVAGDAPSVNIAQYTFAPGDITWGGKRALLANNSVIYSVSGLNIRVNPVDLDLSDVDFTLVNTKNATFPQVVYAATAESADDPITLVNIQGRAANTGNGLWSLSQSSFSLSEAAAEKFQEAITGANGIAYAISAGKNARSLYNVAINGVAAQTLAKVKVKDMANSEFTLSTTEPIIDATEISVDLNKTYKILGDNNGAMYDMYFSVSEVDAKTYGVVYDDLARTFKVTKNPDVSTAASGFKMLVTTLDNNGEVKYAQYKVKLTSNLSNSLAYDAIEFNIENLYNDNKDYFLVDLAKMKTALGDEWTTWANSVDLTQTSVTLHAKADCSDAAALTVTNNSTAMTYALVNADGGAANVNTLKYAMFNVTTANTDVDVVLDKQYYLKVVFKHAANDPINSITVPVKFTAPAVADLFAMKAGYVVDGTINAYFYNVANKNIELSRYFDKMDTHATLALDTDTDLVTKDDFAYDSDALADLSSGILNLDDVEVDANTGKELGYGLSLIVEATDAKYKDSGWAYLADSGKDKYSFTIKVMSPILEGTIKPATGSTIEISANSTDGFNVTKDMITGADYNGNAYNVVPDKTGSDVNDLQWSNEQIDNVTAVKKGGSDNTYIKNVTMKGQYKPGDTVIPGAINILADPLPNTTETAIVVTVTDKWGYKTAKEVSVTIKKN